MRRAHTHTNQQITNETRNVNGRTGAINLSVAAGQQGSGSRPSCQNGASVRTEIVVVVEEIRRQARGELAPSWRITFSNNEMWQTGSVYFLFWGGGAANDHHSSTGLDSDSGQKKV